MNLWPIIYLLYLLVSVYSFSPKIEKLGSFSLSMLAGLVAFFTTHIVLGLSSDLIGISLTKYPNYFVIPLISLFALLGKAKKSIVNKKNGPFPDRHSRFTEDLSWLLPAVYLVSFFRFTLFRAETGLSRFVNHWDVASNISLMVDSLTKGSLSMSEMIYPRAPHFAAALSSSLFGTASGSSPDRVFSIFVAYEWFWMCFLLLSIGVFANAMAAILRLTKVMKYLLVFSSQLIFLVPSVKQNIFDFHSLSLLVGITMILIQVSLCLRFQFSADDVRLKTFILFLCLAVLMLTGFTYPLLAIVQILLLIVISIQSRSIWSALIVQKTLRGPLALLSLFLIFLTLFGLRYADAAWGQLASRATFSTNGAVLTADLSWLIILVALSFLSLLVISTRSIPKSIWFICVSYWIGIVSTVVLSWLAAGNFSREYGLNYYPKKMEWSLFPILAVLAISALASLLNRTKTTQKIAAVLFFPLLLVFTLSLAKNTDPRISELKNRSRSLRIGLMEAKTPGTSLISSENELDTIHVSMLSNTLDFSYLEDKDVDGPPVLPEIVDGARKLFLQFTNTEICHMIWRGFDQVLVSDVGDRTKCIFP